MYRQTDNRKVWYEWMVEVFKLERTGQATGQNNRDSNIPLMSGGRIASPGPGSNKGRDSLLQQKESNSGWRRVRVGMSEMHSSIKDGCLM
jgi:protein arginine N-methyltransferase 5